LLSEKKKERKERKKEDKCPKKEKERSEQAKFLQGLKIPNKGGMLSPRSKCRIRSPPLSSSPFISLASLLLFTCTYDLIV